MSKSETFELSKKFLEILPYIANSALNSQFYFPHNLPILNK